MADSTGIDIRTAISGVANSTISGAHSRHKAEEIIVKEAVRTH